MSLTEFLLARIAEDEASWRACALGDYCPQMDDTRVLAACEAKRQSIEWASSEGLHNPNSEYSRGWMTAGYFILRSLALPYADHPDYDPAWRP